MADTGRIVGKKVPWSPHRVIRVRIGSDGRTRWAHLRCLMPPALGFVHRLSYIAPDCTADQTTPITAAARVGRSRLMAETASLNGQQERQHGQ